MASDNDWYSDESDETFYANKDAEFNETVRTIEEIISTNWEVVDKRIADIKKLENDLLRMRREYSGYRELE
tara:strand:+ start:440 stop:652 length:213 start_codon:yes stop_codon:yes gene_type:complete